MFTVSSPYREFIPFATILHQLRIYLFGNCRNLLCLQDVVNFAALPDWMWRRRRYVVKNKPSSDTISRLPWTSAPPGFKSRPTSEFSGAGRAERECTRGIQFELAAEFHARAEDPASAGTTC